MYRVQSKEGEWYWVRYLVEYSSEVKPKNIFNSQGITLLNTLAAKMKISLMRACPNGQHTLSPY
jgi:hypothetical protein